VPTAIEPLDVWKTEVYIGLNELKFGLICCEICSWVVVSNECPRTVQSNGES
jgi:hypothetical protein